MLVITLPDGSSREFPTPISLLDIAQTISPALAKVALGAQVDDRLVDLSVILHEDSRVRFVTEKDPEGIEIIRHSTAHLLAHAVKELFPSAQVTIGPVIENGFYYDFAFDQPFTPEDLLTIEKRMKVLAQQNLPVKQFSLSRDAAALFFQNKKEFYKAQIIEAIPSEEMLTFYQQGDFVDLCRGPHVPRTGFLKAFKLMRVAGAYWRGDSKNEMLQRIYGTAWANKKELETYLQQLEEAEKRDHRKLAKQLDLYHTQEESPGMIFWHPNGWIVYQVIEQYLRKRLREYDYHEVRTPQIISRTLWEKSGHWEKFFGEMFTTESETHEFAIKPMNCPGHILIFRQGLKSYRDLPLRLAEFGSCHRNEPSGALHGLLRVRNFVQDDGHIFCSEEQIQSEVSTFIEMLYRVYADFGFTEVLLKLATRPPQRIGAEECWDKAEAALALALDEKGLIWEYAAGEGAFYGPKIEFSLRDCLNRVWQCGTIQVDFSMPDRLGASYIAQDGSRQVPVMLHRAICGSLERFLGVLIEQYAGNLPVFLAPVQAVVLCITDKQADYALEIAQKLKKFDVRVKLDLRNEKIGFKIREHTLQKIPYQLVIGDKEVETNTVAVRQRNGNNLGNMSLDSFQTLLINANEQRGRGEI